MNVKAGSYTWFGGGADYRLNENEGDAYLKLLNAPEHRVKVPVQGSCWTKTGINGSQSLCVWYHVP